MEAAHETHRWELTESHVAPVFSGLETGDVPDLKRWLAIRVGHLGSTLERLQLSGIDEFLLLVSAVGLPSRPVPSEKERLDTP